MDDISQAKQRTELLAAIAYERSQAKISGILELILKVHQILKEEGLASSEFK